MITRVINGVKCRKLGIDEHRKIGDVFDYGMRWNKYYERTQRKGGSPCYRPITQASNHKLKRKPKPKASGIEALVCADIADRQRKGIAKYGTTVAENPKKLRYWLNAAYEEGLDKSIYLRRAIRDLDKIIANMEAKGK